MTKPSLIGFALNLFVVLVECGKMCRYRDEPLFPRSHWNLKAGGGCYMYCPKDWFLDKAVMGVTRLNISGVIYRIPYAKVGNKTATFDYTNAHHSQVIASTFKTEAFYSKWVSCARNGDACCDYMDEENITPNVEYPCAAVWDAWTCFKPAKADSVSEMACPDYSSSAKKPPCILYSQKQCWANGTWNQQTDYSTCAAAPVQRRRHNFHLIVLYASIALCLPAVVVFFAYPSLRILRVILHRNLLVACVVRNILAAVQKDVVILDSLKPVEESNKVLMENGVACRILAVLTNISANAIFACMLLDAVYLHKLIVRIFAPDPNIYVMYVAALGMSVLPTAIWAALFAINSDEYCWTANSSWYQWIPDGFRIAVLAINVVLLFDIYRGLIRKLKHNVSSQQTKSTLKAMSFLLPLFGVPFILTSSRDIVDRNSCLAGDIYYYISYTIQALQGFMVALLYCYWNKEVQNLVKGTWKKFKMWYRERFGMENIRRRTTNTTQRDTQNTLVRTSGLPNNILNK